MYTSHVAVVEFVEALGTWVEESLLNRLKKTSYYSIMADECTDVTTMEELSVFCRWGKWSARGALFRDRSLAAS